MTKPKNHKKSEMVIEVPDANADVFDAEVTPSMLPEEVVDPGVVDPTQPGGGDPTVQPGVVTPAEPLGPVAVDPITNMPLSPAPVAAEPVPEFVPATAKKKATPPASLDTLLAWLKTHGVNDPEIAQGKDGQWLITSPVDHVFHVAPVGNVVSASIKGQDGVFFLEVLVQG